MPETQLSVLKVAIAAVGCGFFLWRGRQAHPRVARFGALALAIAATSAYFHCFELPFDGYYHRWEMFHYYLGSKYSSELGYQRLYECVAVADAETGHAASVAARRARDLTTDALVPARTFLSDTEECKRHFTNARWSAFKRDVIWFRKAAGSGRWWEQMQADHGYNATPVWTLIGRPIASLAPASGRFLRALAAIDLVLMAGCIAVIGWAFGWEIAAIAAFFWGTQAASEFFWTGGAFLRQDWLFFSVVSVALLKKRHPFAAGVTLSAAGLLRVFPALLWAGPLLVIASSALRGRGLTRSGRRLLAGGALSAAVLIGASIATQGTLAYREFAQRITLHAQSPISNHMSLRTLFSATQQGRLERTVDASRVDPFRPWADARRARAAKMRPAQWLATLTLLAFFCAVVWRLRTLWVALCLSIALIPVLSDPSCYYYSVFLLAVPLCALRRDLPVALAALSGAGQLLSLRFTWVDDRFVALAALYVLFAVVLLGAFARWPLVGVFARADAGPTPRIRGEGQEGQAT